MSLMKVSAIQTMQTDLNNIQLGFESRVPFMLNLKVIKMKKKKDLSHLSE